MTKILVTGAAGFVGQHVVKQLLEREYAVRALVRKSQQSSWLEKLGAEVVVGDLKDSDSLSRACNEISGIINIASTFRQANLPSSEYYAINEMGVQNLFEAAIKKNVQRVIHCSTVGVHGHVESPPANESSPLRPGDVYQKTKLLGEQIASKYFSSGKMSGAIIRPGMIWGPSDTRTAKLVHSVIQKKFFYVGSGDALVHFVDVRYLASSFIELLHQNDITNDVFIVTGRTSIPLKEMCNRIASLGGVQPPWLHLPLRPVKIAAHLCESICVPLGIEPPIFPRRIDFFTKSRSFDSSKFESCLQIKAPLTLDQEIIHNLYSYGHTPINFPKGDIILDNNNRVLYLSAKAEENTGWKHNEAVGAHIKTLKLVDTISKYQEKNSSMLIDNVNVVRVFHC